MTTEQLEHYLIGGVFEAIYDPVMKDTLVKDNLTYVGKKIQVYQNWAVCPIISDTFTTEDGKRKYEGQHRFNSPVIRGWIPEEDLKDLAITDERKSSDPTLLPQWRYRMTYTTQEQLIGNFGVTGEQMRPPVTIGREYDECRNDYVVNELNQPKATLIEVSAWNPLDPDWKEEWVILWDQSQLDEQEIKRLEAETEEDHE